MSASVFSILRAARDCGGTVENCVTRYDDERQGRVLEFRVFWPGDSGYDLPPGPPLLRWDDKP